MKRLLIDLKNTIYSSLNTLISLAAAYYKDKGEIPLKREFFISDIFEDGEGVLYTITKFRSNGTNLEFYVEKEDSYEGDYWILNNQLIIDNLLLLMEEVLELENEEEIIQEDKIE